MATRLASDARAGLPVLSGSGTRAALSRLATWPAWRVAATTLVAYVALSAALAGTAGIDSFIGVGSSLVGKSERSARISHLHPVARVGYDGQYSYFIALDPLRARYYMDRPSYRYGRILYPAVAWIAALGQPGALPYTLLAINILAIVGTVYLLGAYLARRRASPWWAAVYGFYPGLTICLLADLTEPLAYFLAASGLLLLERKPRRPLAAAAVFALAALARETTLVFPAVAAAAVALRGRNGSRFALSSIRTGSLFFVVSAAPYVAYRWALVRWLGTGLQEWKIALAPFGGFAAWPFDREHVFVLLAVIVPGLVWLALAGWALVHGRAGIAPSLVAANVVLFVIWLPPIVYSNFGGAARTSIGLALAAVFSIPLLRRSLRPRSAILAGALASLTVAWVAVAAIVAAVV